MRSAFLFCLALSLAAPAFGQTADDEIPGTFSIIGRDPDTGELGIGVHSRTIAVGSRTRSAKGGVAVVAHQAASNPMYGMLGIQLIETGMDPQQALDFILRADDGRESRQVAILDSKGRTAAFTGKNPNEWKGHKCGLNYCAQGNILTGPDVVESMAKSFESSSGPLAERLVAALEAAQAAGGDARGMESAGLMIVNPLAGAGGFSDRAIDIRVDEHRTPIAELRRVLNVFRSGELITSANAKLRDRNLPEALKLAEAAKEKAPSNDNAWIALASVRLAMNDRPQALDALRRAVSINGSNKKQLLRNRAFEVLRSDPEFEKIVR